MGIRLFYGSDDMLLVITYDVNKYHDTRRTETPSKSSQMLRSSWPAGTEFRL